MLTFDKENKITFEQLSFSLQNKLRKSVTRSELEQLQNIVELYEKCLNNVRFSVVNATSEIINPINNKEVAIVNKNGAFFLYVYTKNKWIRIPKDDVYYKINIVQSPYQTITLKSGGINYTSAVNLKYGATWTATIKSTSTYYKAGDLTASSGVVSKSDSISAEPASIIYNFTANATISKHKTKDNYGVRLNINNDSSTSDYYGNMTPKLFDTFYIRKYNNDYYSCIKFLDSPKKAVSEYKFVTITLEYENNTLPILQNCDLINFDNTGCLTNFQGFTTEYYYETFKSLKGKKVNLYIHFDRAT